MNQRRVASLSLHWSLALAIFAVVSAAPTPHGKLDDIVMVEDIISVSTTNDKAGDRSSNVALITLSESSTSEQDSNEDGVSDDLIFLSRKSQTQKPEAPQAQPLDASASEETEQEAVPSPATAAVSPIDMSVFVALIPARQVQSIAANYYRHDKEVQRAYAFLSSEYFAEMKQHIMQLPEVLAFTRYLNASGLDVLKLTQSVMEAIKPPRLLAAGEGLDSVAGSELATPLANVETNSTKEEQLNGLHGLVDSVLDVLPQDQILATFFDKIETDQQFSRLIDSIGTPKFSKILSNLQNSVPLRNLIFELHNNRIYVARIVESLKSYFFLSSF